MSAVLLFGFFLVAPPVTVFVNVLVRRDADRRCAWICRTYWEIQRLERVNLDLAARGKRLAKKQAKARLARAQMLFGPWSNAA